MDASHGSRHGQRRSGDGQRRQKKEGASTLQRSGSQTILNRGSGASVAQTRSATAPQQPSGQGFGRMEETLKLLGQVLSGDPTAIDQAEGSPLAVSVDVDEAPVAPARRRRARQVVDEAAKPTPAEPELKEAEDSDGASDMSEAEPAEEEENDSMEVLDEKLLAPVTLSEFQCLLAKIEIPEEEAEDIYEAVAKEFTAGGASYDPSVGIPLKDFLDDLQIDAKDSEGIQKITDGLEDAREEARAIAQGGGVRRPVTPGLDKVIEVAALDRLVRIMDYMKKPPKEAAKMLPHVYQYGILAKRQYEALQSLASDPKELQKRVEKQMVLPPLMNSCAGQGACKAICIKKVTDIIEKCKADGTKFTDPEWDMTTATSKVWYVDKEAPGYDCTVGEPAKFKRLSSIVQNAKSGMASLFGGGASKKKIKPIVFKGSVAAGDVVQGSIGTCFLLGAIGAMACSRESSFEKIFIKYDTEIGVYGVRFFIDGEWTHVIVDDWMPVDWNGNLLFARCKDPQEVWVPILEKAYCKIHTCYEMCDGGHANEAISAFFGGVSGKFEIKDEHREDPSKYFKLLVDALNRGWVLTTSYIPGRGHKSQGGGKCGEDMLACGLVGGHAYSVLKVVEACGNQLVLCRNPWGTGEWTGKWSDRSDAWTDEMLAAVGPKFKRADDGGFFMDIADFVANSAGVDYARSFGPNWKKASHYGHFQAAQFQGIAKRDYKAKNARMLGIKKGDEIIVTNMDSTAWWQGQMKNGSGQGFVPARMIRLTERAVLRYDITVAPDKLPKPLVMVVQLGQRNAYLQRKYYQLENGMNYKDVKYPQVGLIVLDPEGNLHSKKGHHTRMVWCSVSCRSAGTWRVYCFSGSGEGEGCLTRIYVKGGQAKFNEHPGASFSEIAPFMNDTA
mmetsp:Transcript_90420/g.165901  ORF Transcript_90420/g.165901 Transcript_90420/m.165901 type:complete len:896 (-) Transcript_90420:166-2853(-)